MWSEVSDHRAHQYAVDDPIEWLCRVTHVVEALGLRGFSLLGRIKRREGHGIESPRPIWRVALPIMARIGANIIGASNFLDMRISTESVS